MTNPTTPLYGQKYICINSATVNVNLIVKFPSPVVGLGQAYVALAPITITQNNSRTFTYTQGVGWLME